jgi:hypothetical protein
MPASLRDDRREKLIAAKRRISLRPQRRTFYSGPTTDLLDRAIARLVPRFVGDEEPPVALTDEDRAAIAASKAAAARGEFTTEAQVRAVWAKHGL